MANPPSKPPRGIKTPKETVSTLHKNCFPFTISYVYLEGNCLLYVTKIKITNKYI